MDIKITEDQSITSFQESVEKNYQYANKNYNRSSNKVTIVSSRLYNTSYTHVSV